MRILICDWRLRLPMASAVLAILYPEQFTVYDYRVAEQIGYQSKPENKSNFDVIWDGYISYREGVTREGTGRTLRDKDRHFFGKSKIQDLRRDIAAGFTRE